MVDIALAPGLPRSSLLSRLRARMVARHTHPDISHTAQVQPLTLICRLPLGPCRT